MNEREAYIALNMIERIGPVTVRSLVSELGSAAAIFSAGRDELLRAQGVGPETAGAILAGRENADWPGESARAEALGARIVTRVDGEYPEPLAQIHDPPLALYVRGSLQARDRHAIAVVGTRRPTHYGRAVAEHLAFQLAKAGLTVVSGLAEGIDTSAHRGALNAGGRTLAVLGGALDALYPPSNAGLADEIALSGAVVTEFPIGRRPDKTTFAIRNRIVSGLSLGAIVVEAGATSGALITAREAGEQGRTVFAVPGRIDNRAACGPNRLIRDGARLIESADDVLEELQMLLPRGAAARKPTGGDAPPVRLSDEEAAVMAALPEGESDVDALIRACGLPAARVSGLLVGLEMKRQIRMLPGRRIARAAA